MSEQDDSARIKENESAASGLLLSVEPLAGGEKLHAQEGDGTDTDTDLADTSDAADADGTDESERGATDGDGTDGTDGDGTDGGVMTTDSDGSDASGDADGSDAG